MTAIETYVDSDGLDQRAEVVNGHTSLLTADKPATAGDVLAELVDVQSRAREELEHVESRRNELRQALGINSANVIVTVPTTTAAPKPRKPRMTAVDNHARAAKAEKPAKAAGRKRGRSPVTQDADKLANVLAAIKAGGAEGVATTWLMAKLDMSRVVALKLGHALVADKKVKTTGKNKSARWVAC